MLPQEPLKQMLPSKVCKQFETDNPYNTAECSTSQKVKQLTNNIKALQQQYVGETNKQKYEAIVGST